MSHNYTPNGGDSPANFNEQVVRQFWEMLSLPYPRLANLYQGVSTDEPNGDWVTHYRKISDLDGLVELCRAGVERGASVYAEMGLLAEKPDLGERAKAADVVAVRGFWGEADIKADGHDSGDDGAESREQVMEFISELPVEPTMLLHSGGGIHWHIMLERPEYAHNPEQNKGYRRNHKFFEKASKAVAKLHGFKICSVADLARPMRVPGTFNPKRSKMANILYYKPENLYDVKRDLEAWVKDHISNTPIRPTAPTQQSAPPPTEESLERAAQTIAELMPTDHLHDFLIPLTGYLRGTKGTRLSSDDTLTLLDRAWTISGRPRMGDREGLRNPLETTNRRIDEGNPEILGGRGLEEFAPGLADALAKILEFDSVDHEAREIARNVSVPSEIYKRMDVLSKTTPVGIAAVKSILRERFPRAFRVREFDNAIKSGRKTANKTDKQKQIGEARNMGLPLAIMDGLKFTQDVDTATTAMHEVNSENGRPTYYNRGGSLSDTIVNEDDRTELRRHHYTSLRGVLDRTIRFMRWVEKPPNSGMFVLIDCSPPSEVVADLLVNVTAEFPALKGLSQIPVMAPSGSVLSDPGYDPVTGVIYEPPEDLAIPDVPTEPTEADVARAKAQIAKVLGDFPYVDDASETNTVALLITSVIRDAIDGRVPFFLVDKVQAGTGGSLLAEAVANVSVGVFQAAGAPEDEDEFRKFITSQVDMGARMVILDNLEGTIKSPALSRLITADNWQDRRLGSTEIIDVPNKAVVVGTGNNVAVGGDLPRRTVWIRLNALQDKPWRRDPSEFKIKNLAAYTREKRGQLAADVLTLARAWFAAGCPQADVPMLGSFEEWCKVVGGILAHVGYEGFLANIDEFYEHQDSEADEWEYFLSAWLEVFSGEQPITLEHFTEIYYSLTSDGLKLRESLPNTFGKAASDKFNSAGFKRQLGVQLKRIMTRRFGDEGIYIDKGTPDRHKKVQTWIVKCDDGEAQTRRTTEAMHNRVSRVADEVYVADENMY